MITIDRSNKQILSSLCFNCQDDAFQPPTRSFPKVGCCSYSPTFYLLEISNMCKKTEAIDVYSILHHPAAQLEEYKVTIKAKVHPSFNQLSLGPLTSLEKDDLRHSYSICHFFIENKGCSLDPAFKNAVCRSFICTKIEESLQYDKDAVQQMTNQIRKEEVAFQQHHENILKQKGINLLTSPTEVIQYFETS